MAGQTASDMRGAYWLYQLLPPKAIAYGQLMRLDRPIGARLLFWPCIWGLLLGFYQLKLSFAAGGALRPASPCLPFSAAYYYAFSPLGFFIFAAILLFCGAALMRGAGCAYNDLADQQIDARVARTATRPLPSGRVSRRRAWALIAALMALSLILLLQFNRFTIILTLASLIIVAFYPFAKRVFAWPQAVLGLCFNWGALTGFAAICGALSWPAVGLYAGAVLWTIGYDTIYAHQDREDDALLGLHSTALLFGARSRLMLGLLYGLSFALIFIAFYAAGGGWWAGAGVILAGCILLYQLLAFDMNKPDLCLKLFKANNWAGWALTAPAFIGLCF